MINESLGDFPDEKPAYIDNCAMKSFSKGVTTKIFEFFKEVGNSWITFIKDGNFANDKDDPLASESEAPLGDKNSIPLAGDDVQSSKRKRARKRAIRATKNTEERDLKAQIKKRNRLKRGERPRRKFSDDEDDSDVENVKKKSNPRRRARPSKRTGGVRKPKVKPQPKRPFSPDLDDDAILEAVENDTDNDILGLGDDDVAEDMPKQEEESDYGPPWLTGEGETIIEERQLYSTKDEDEFQRNLENAEVNVPEDTQDEPELRTLYKHYSEDRKLLDAEKMIPDPDKYLTSASELDEEVTEENKAEYEEYTRPVPIDPELEQTGKEREKLMRMYRMEGSHVLNTIDNEEGTVVGAEVPTLEEYNELIDSPEMQNVDEEIEKFKKMDMASQSEDESNNDSNGDDAKTSNVTKEEV